MVLAQLDVRRVTLADYPIARAILLSLLLHALLFATTEIGYQAGLWKATMLFAKEQAQLDKEQARRLLAQRQKEQAAQEPPLLFVEVDPSQESTEPPPDAKYYSSLSSRAANPQPQNDTDTPKIDGRQEHVPQTLDRARPEPQPLQPTPPKPPQPEPLQPQLTEKPPEPQPEPQPLQPAPPPEPVQKPGDLAYLKPREEVQPAPPSQPAATAPKPAPPSRIRRLADLARPKAGMAGEKVKQKGGVKRFALEPSFDVRATPFGAYDAQIIAAIQKRWYDLLDAHESPGNYTGKVVVEFRLNSDGHVTDLRVNDSDVGEIPTLLCQRAVQDPAPFAKWPPDLRRLVGKDYREVRFTFYYN